MDQVTEWATGAEIEDELGLPPPRINDAVSFLELNGYAETPRMSSHSSRSR